MLLRRRMETKRDYDRKNEEPAVMCSICTCEQVAGFRDRRTGKFRDVMLIRDERDLERFKRECGVEEILKLY